MIVQQVKNESVHDDYWMAAAKGALRPIIVEASTRQEALQLCAEQVHIQEAEDYAMAEQFTALSLEGEQQ